jgi:copper chaperone
MIELNLPDMTCGHCASTVAKTVALVDPAAKVEVDLNTKLVKISSNEAGRNSPKPSLKLATRRPGDPGLRP